jgi:hypothetical protein
MAAFCVLDERLPSPLWGRGAGGEGICVAQIARQTLFGYALILANFVLRDLLEGVEQAWR